MKFGVVGKLFEIKKNFLRQYENFNEFWKGKLRKNE